jgi:hypothetical protein
MKTVKIILLASVLLAAGITKTMAGENEVYNRAYSQLDEKVRATLDQFPFEAINGQDNSCLMVLTFTVNEEHRMDNIRVESEDKPLANYVLSVLKRKNIELDPVLDGKNCRVPLRFVVEE